MNALSVKYEYKLRGAKHDIAPLSNEIWTVSVDEHF